MKILHIIPYTNFFPPTNGGALRCYHISQQLAKFADVTVLTNQNKETFGIDSVYTWDSSVNVVNPKPLKKGRIHSYLRAITYRWKRKNIFEKANINYLLFEPEIRKLIKENEFEAVVFEHLESEKLSDIFRKNSPNTIRIVDQHNVDHLLAQQESPNTSNNNLRYQESTLFKRNHIIWACSEKDKNIFLSLNKHKVIVDVIPNGVEIEMKNFVYPKDYSQKVLLFCGALDTAANTDALKWLYYEIWPELKNEIPDIRLHIVGKSNDYSRFNYLIKDPQIHFIGEVKKVDHYYHISNISIVPLRIGSGTRLKILEAMSFGNPIVTTSLGAEGIEYSNNENLLIANEKNEFVNAVKLIINNQEFAGKMVINARKLVEATYSWDVIGTTIKKSFSNYHNLQISH